MVLMKYFCFCVPVRLGVIITSTITMIENAILLIGILMYSSEELAEYADKLKDKTKENSYETTSKELYEILSENVKDYAAQFRFALIILYAGCIAASVINIIAALTKNRLLSIPFIILRFIEIAGILTLHVNYMLYMKKYWNLGVLIAACCAGGFLMLFLLYLWGVTISMFQMIGVVNSKKYQEMLEKSRQPIVVVKKPKNQEIATIAGYDYDFGVRMVTSDFNGIHKHNFRRI